MYALNLDADGRILSATFPEYAPDGAVLAEALPEWNISDYLYRDGAFLYEPLPRPEPAAPVPTVESRVAKLEKDSAELAEAVNILLTGAIE